MSTSNPIPTRAGALRDARLFQILALGLLLSAGAAWRDFAIRLDQVLLTFAAAIVTQAVLNRARGSASPGLRSAIITAFSLSILLRADAAWVHPIAAVAAIGSKFFLRVGGKHVFNPGNLGVIAAILLLPGTWVSAGQWGHEIALAGWFVALGTIVVHRAERADVTWAFLVFYLGAIGLRVAWLGQSTAVWHHQLANGAILLFAFFMISDPMTIPNHRRGRILHAALTAGLAFVWQYQLYRTNGLLWALFVTSPLVPLWDRVWPASKFEWIPQGGTTDEPSPARDARPLVGSLARPAA